jgi:hypothetical protein
MNVGNRMGKSSAIPIDFNLFNETKAKGLSSLERE